MNNILTVLSTMDIGCTAVLIMCLYLFYLRLFCSHKPFELSDPIQQNNSYQRKQANLGEFSIFAIRNRTIICLNQPYNWLVLLYCTDLSSNNPKKKGFCLQIVLGQTLFEFYWTAAFFCWTHPFWMRIGLAY